MLNHFSVRDAVIYLSLDVSYVSVLIMCIFKLKRLYRTSKWTTPKLFFWLLLLSTCIRVAQLSMRSFYPTDTKAASYFYINCVTFGFFSYFCTKLLIVFFFSMAATMDCGTAEIRATHRRHMTAYYVTCAVCFVPIFTVSILWSVFESKHHHKRDEITTVNPVQMQLIRAVDITTGVYCLGAAIGFIVTGTRYRSMLAGLTMFSRTNHDVRVLLTVLVYGVSFVGRFAFDVVLLVASFEEGENTRIMKPDPIAELTLYCCTEIIPSFLAVWALRDELQEASWGTLPTSNVNPGSVPSTLSSPLVKNVGGNINS